ARVRQKQRGSQPHRAGAHHCNCRAVGHGETRLRGFVGVNVITCPVAHEPAKSAATKRATSPGTSPRLAMAGPGQNPDRPQPTPKIAAPASNGRSIFTRLVVMKAGAASGVCNL